MHGMTRRQLLTAGAGAAVAVVAGWIRPAALLAEQSPIDRSIEHYGGFRMGIQSYSLRHFNLEATVGHVADMELHWIEFFPRHFPVTQDRERIAAVKRLLDPHHISMPVHGVHGFTGNAARNRAIFEFAKKAGIGVLSAHPTDESFPILHDLVQEFDIRIGIHNHGPGHRFDRIEQSLEAVERWDRRIGFCPDTGHYMRSGEDPVEAVEKLSDRLYGIHLKDHARIARDNPPETILGEGAMDLNAMCHAMRKAGFTGPISLEYERNPRDPIADIRKGLANFARAARRTR